MINEIQEKYRELPNKMKFIQELANELGKSPRSLQANWFAGFWSIPKKYQEKVLTKLNEKLK